MKRLLLRVAALLGCVFVATAPAQSRQAIPLYGDAPFVHEADAKSAELERQQRVAELKSGAYGGLANFTAKARLSLRTENRPAVGETRNFTVQSPQAGPSGQWRREDAWHLWRRDAREAPLPLVLPVAPENEGKPFQLADFDELWLDYHVSPSVSQCEAQASFEASIPSPGGDSGTRRRVAASTGAWPGRLKPLVAVDAAAVPWSEKEYAYVVRRLLRLAPDEGWRYAPSGGNTVVQRRLHVPLGNVEELLIAVAPGTTVGHVNLLFSAKDDYRSGELLELASPPVVALPDGRHAVRLNVREALQWRFPKETTENATDPGRHSFYLQEVLAFIPGEPAAVSAGKPVHGLVFLGHGGESLVTLPHRRVDLDGNRRRFVFDLRQLSRKPGVAFENAALALAGGREATSCALRIDELKAVGVHDRYVPSISTVLDQLANRWGAVSNATPRPPDEIGYPRVIAFLPLSTLTVTASPAEGTVQYVVKPGPADEARLERTVADARPLHYRILGSNGRQIVPDRARLVSTVGAVLRAEGTMPRASGENELLVLEGKSRALEISWPVQERLDDNSRFFFAVGEGAGDLGRVTVLLELAGGGVVQRDVVPNIPLQLRAGDVEARRITVRMEPAVSPFRVKLREIAIYSQARTSLAEAFTIALPKKQIEIPTFVPGDTSDAMLQLAPGLITGVTPPRGTARPVAFSIPFEPPLDWIRGLQVEHVLPAGHAKGPACRLKVRFNWASGPGEAQVCFDKPVGTMFIPMADFIGEAPRPANLGALKSIDFELDPNSAGQEAPQSFSLRIHVDGRTMVSAADELRYSPAFSAGGKPIRAMDRGSDDIVAAKFPPEAWLPLEEGALAAILDAGGKIQPTGRWPYDVVQVVAEAKQPIDLDPVPKAADMPAAKQPSPWPGRLVLIGAILLAWGAWKRGWWSPARVSRLGSAGFGTVLRVGRSWLDTSVRWGSQWLPQVNLAIAALALGPGLWWAGRLGLDFPGLMVLATSLLVAWAGYRHWRVQTGRDAREHESRTRVMFAASVVALGCAAWSLGKFGLRGEALWGLLPLLGVIYALSLALHGWALRFIPAWRRYLLAAACLAVAFVLYAVDWPAFGALVSVVALRMFLGALEPFLRRVAPATAGRIYGGAGSVYFSGALLMMVAIAIALMFKPGLIAEQFSIVVYYCVVIGIAKEAWALGTRPSAAG